MSLQPGSTLSKSISRPESRLQCPRAVIETMHRATAELIESAAAQRARKAGDVAPSFSLKDRGERGRLGRVAEARPLVLSFYRGVWCPYCNMELQALEAARAEFDRYGATLVAISPQTAPNSRKSVRQNKLSFPILSDVKGKVGAAFGLRQSARLPGRALQQLKNDLPTSTTIRVGRCRCRPLRHRTGRRDPLLRGEPDCPPARA